MHVYSSVHEGDVRRSYQPAALSSFSDVRVPQCDVQILGFQMSEEQILAQIPDVLSTLSQKTANMQAKVHAAALRPRQSGWIPGPVITA